jgi:multimeric flavodoxin WrbA/putative sterol carrier protein
MKKMSADKQAKKEEIMSDQLKVVAVNGSPHAGIGNTSLMLEMLRPTLAEEGFDLEVINLAGQHIEYCAGCAFCMEKGACWIDDDHRKILKRLLAADGIILASPVYFFHVTGRMKNFLDRSLALGHKPRQTWKPGLALSVSAGMGETDTADYLANVLRVFGAFSVGALTAMATRPGEFLGKEVVAARAVDLSRDLARAIREKRRYPATDQDLRFYQFMGNLIESNKETTMKHDYRHWQEHGFYEGFEKYARQSRAEVPFHDSARQAWIEEMIKEQKSRKTAQSRVDKKEQGSAVPEAGSCRELLRTMPLGLDPRAAGDVTAVLEFEINGNEHFTSHLEIASGVCTYRDGPAEKPDLVIKSPADVWLKISRGELDGRKAFMEGRYRVEGDMGLLLKVKNLFPAHEERRTQ